MASPLVQITSSKSSTPSQPRKSPYNLLQRMSNWQMDVFLEELTLHFETPLRRDLLMSYSTKLQDEYKSRLQESEISMLPSYNHTLPTGEETGDCLALDVGGSTFRIALIRLSGRASEKRMEIIHSASYEIDHSVKTHEGQKFFDWMALRIEEMLADAPAIRAQTLSMGLAWSFPVEQTSSQTGNLLAMGKGFSATIGLEGEDLSDIIMRSCRARNLPVKMGAIVNDASATLLSQAYLDASARMSLILGTGMNAAVYLPVQCVASAKYGSRPASWHATARHVLVNTELSMFGKRSLPVTKYDDVLDSQHQHPGFQPMEYLIGGLYLGEIARLILLEAIKSAGLFGGEQPRNFAQPYSLGTRTIAAFEEDTTADLIDATSRFLILHHLDRRPSKADSNFIRSVVKLVSRRAQAYLATAIHALWMLRNESEGVSDPADGQSITVACNGTVIEKYPHFRSSCQEILDSLCVASGATIGTISLDMAPESSIYGAAVAVSCIKEG